jgi:type II secretory pathway predicted ATPase ExeA
MSAERLLSTALRAWGARAVPFTDPGELFRTAGLERTLALLDQSAALRSLMLLSGENGVGKSALAASWLRALDPKTYFPIAVTQASLSAAGIFGLFLQKLGKTPRHQRNSNLKLLEEAFAELGRIIPVLLLDEAQNYSMSALEEVRMLLGLNLPQQPAFALILVGDQYLLSTLRLRSHRALYSRIAVHARLEKLTHPEVELYLAHHLRAAGIERDCFEAAAIDLLAAASEGFPRTINLLARAAWLEAGKDSTLFIGPKHVQSALELVPGALNGRRETDLSTP